MLPETANAVESITRARTARARAVKYAENSIAVSSEASGATAATRASGATAATRASGGTAGNLFFYLFIFSSQYIIWILIGGT